MLTIRAGSVEEVSGFQLFSDENEGDEILVAEDNGAVVGYCQHSGAYVYFLESTQKGAGTFLVNHLKQEYDWLQACNVGKTCCGFWERVGFEKTSSSGERPGEFHYEWCEE